MDSPTGDIYIKKPVNTSFSNKIRFLNIKTTSKLQLISTLCSTMVTHGANLREARFRNADKSIHVWSST